MMMMMMMMIMIMMKRHVCPSVCPVHPSVSFLSHPSVRLSWPSILFDRRGCVSVPSVPLAPSACLVGPSVRLVRCNVLRRTILFDRRFRPFCEFAFHLSVRSSPVVIVRSSNSVVGPFHSSRTFRILQEQLIWSQLEL